MSAPTGPRPRKSGLFSLRRPSAVKKLAPADGGVAVDDANLVKPSSPDHPAADGGERTVKKLRLSKAVTVPERTTVSDACRRMAARRVDAVLVTDATGLLSGIVTDKDIAIRVIAEGLRPEQTIVAKIMTRNPVFVSSETRAIEALQKMVEGKFRHLPIVENSEVIALLDITKCLFDAISRMEKAAEQGSAVAAAVEGVERQWGSNFSAQYAFIETLRERMFKPSLASIIPESSKVAAVSLSDPVYIAARRMRELQSTSVVVVSGGKPQGILTSRDILMRVVAQRFSPELTLVEKVMTANPECVTVETTILDALQILHDRKFLHIPVLDKEGFVVACLDVLQLTHAALSSIGSDSTMNGVADTMMQKFWDSVLSLDPPDNEHETCSEASGFVGFEGVEGEKTVYPSLSLGNSFAFKFEDRKGRVNRFNCGSEDLGELVSAIGRRTGVDFCQLLYEDDEGDRVLLSTDGDLVGAVNHAKASGRKVLRLYLDYSEEETPPEIAAAAAPAAAVIVDDSVRPPSSLRPGVLGSAVAIAGVAVLVVYLRRSNP